MNYTRLAVGPLAMAVLLGGLALNSGAAQAQAVPMVTLVTVDSVGLVQRSETTDLVELSITGIPQGQTSPQTVVVSFESGALGQMQAAECKHSALLAMAKPGRFVLTVPRDPLSLVYRASNCVLSVAQR